MGNPHSGRHRTGSVGDVVDVGDAVDTASEELRLRHIERHIEAVRVGLARTARVRADLEGELQAIEESTSSVPDDEHDPEGSTVGYERARIGALLALARREADNLTAAMDRAADGGYGRCNRCNRDIGSERLIALPAATTCVRCAGR